MKVGAFAGTLDKSGEVELVKAAIVAQLVLILVMLPVSCSVLLGRVINVVVS